MQISITYGWMKPHKEFRSIRKIKLRGGAACPACSMPIEALRI
jgi:hypothetical protein